MEYTKKYKVEQNQYTKEGKEIKILYLQPIDENTVLDEWAEHFREQYRYMDDLDFQRDGTGLSREEFLRDFVFPDTKKAPGPSVRVGDFCELLVADYIEYVSNFYVPRTRYRGKINRDSSPQGSDLLGFKTGKKASERDVALIYEVKGTSDPKSAKKGYQRLQDAVDDSNKDLVRYAESLNATKMKLRDLNEMEQVSIVTRFQNRTDRPYVIKYGASAVLTEEKYNEEDLKLVSTEGHHSKHVELLVIHTDNLKKLIDEMYRRAAIC